MQTRPGVDSQLFSARGFLPAQDPLSAFPAGSPYEMLDQLGRDLPSLLLEPDCRAYLAQVSVPSWQQDHAGAADSCNALAQLQLYYMRLGFVCSGFINQLGQAACHELPANLAVPFCLACRQLQRPAMLSYDGYALYNWKRFDPRKPIALGNIDTLQNFVHLYDEHWFILVHVEIEAIAADMLSALVEVEREVTETAINRALRSIAHALKRMLAVLRRIPERMSPELYFCCFRPYIRFFEGVKYLGVKQPKIDYRGETGAQSSIMPALVAFMKIPHQPSELVNHLRDMRRYMPAEHRQFVIRMEQLAPIRPLADRVCFDSVLEDIASFREQHFQWARQYVNDRVSDPRGTGGTPYMKWLQQLIDETRAFKFSN